MRAMDETELDELVARGGRTPDEWAALTPEQRLLAAVDAQAAAGEVPPAEVGERVREMYLDR